MNWRSTTALTVFSGLALSFALAAQAADDVSAAIGKLEKEMRQAQKDNDAAWYRNHLADGYVEGHSWGEWKNKDEAIKDTEAKMTKTASSEVTDMKVMTFGSKVAVAHYKMTYDATMGATHRARSVICSDTWMDESGAWKVISNHCSHIEGT
jgi:hypothetical protein